MTEQNEREAAAVRGQSIIDVINTVPANTADEERVRMLAANLGYEYGYRAGQPQWIAVSERFPSESGYYLVTVNGVVWMAFCAKRDDGSFCWIDVNPDNNKGGLDVIAWMPLPSPYTESDNTEVSDGE